METFLIIAGIFGYLNSFMVSIIHIKDKDKLKPIEIDWDTKLTSDEWKSIESEEGAKRMTIMSPILHLLFSFMFFILGLDPFEVNPCYNNVPGFLITGGVILILLFIITIGRIFYRIINAQHTILNNVGVYINKE